MHARVRTKVKAASAKAKKAAKPRTVSSESDAGRSGESAPEPPTVIEKNTQDPSNFTRNMVSWLLVHALGIW